MDPNRRNYFVDAFMGIVFFACFITGLVKFPGFLSTLGIRPGSLPMEQIGLIHQWAGLAIGIIVMTHVLLHSAWIMNMTKALLKKKE